MKQLNARDLRRIKAKSLKKGNDPSVVSRKKKFVFNSSRYFNLSVPFTTGVPTGNLTSGGISTYTIKFNDLYRPFGGITPADGFNHVSDDYTNFYVIGGKLGASFDMINCGGMKAFMLITPSANIWASLGIEPDFSTAVAAAFSREQLLEALEEKYHKSLITNHWLQIGNGYNSVGRMTLKYSPAKFDPDRKPLLSDDNATYSTTGGAGTNAVGSPSNNDYVHVVLMPNSDVYNATYQGDSRAMIWGKFYLQQIAIAINNETEVYGYRDVNLTAELSNQIQISDTNPTAAA